MGGRTVSVLIAVVISYLPCGLAAAGLIFCILGNWQLSTMMFSMLSLMLAIQVRLTKWSDRQIQAEKAWLDQLRGSLELCNKILSDSERAMRANAPRTETDAATLKEVHRLRDEIEQARREM